MALGNTSASSSRAEFKLVSMFYKIDDHGVYKATIYT